MAVEMDSGTASVEKDRVAELVEAIRSELRPEYQVTPGGLKWSRSTDALLELLRLARSRIGRDVVRERYQAAVDSCSRVSSDGDFDLLPYYEGQRDALRALLEPEGDESPG